MVESSCFVRLSYVSENESFGLEEAIKVEKELSEYFDSLPSSKEKGQPFSHVKPYRFHVDLADHIFTSAKSTITAIATLLYEYDEGEELPVVLETAFESLELKSDFSFGKNVQFDFSPATSGTFSELDYRNPRGRSASEIGLIFVTILLSILLLMTSSVLLHITGGWVVFKNALIHCLFEEVEIDDRDDFDVMKRKPTYSRSDDEDDEEEVEDEESNITSVPPSSASGMLGVRGILRSPTMSEGDESSMTYGDSSPTNYHTSLGINPHSPRGQGMAGMMLQRFGRTPGKNE